FEAVADEFLANEQIHSAYERLVATLDQLLEHAQDAGTIRSDVSAIDVLMLVKGVCQAASAFQHLDPAIAERQLDLVRAALAPPSDQSKLRGRRATVEDMERAHRGASAPRSRRAAG